MIILLSRSDLAFFASSGDSVTVSEFGEVGEISNWIEQSFPVQPLSQKHWFKFEQICGKKCVLLTLYYYVLLFTTLGNVSSVSQVHLPRVQSTLNYYDYWDIYCVYRCTDSYSCMFDWYKSEKITTKIKMMFCNMIGR